MLTLGVIELSVVGIKAAFTVEISQATKCMGNYRVVFGGFSQPIIIF